MNDRSSPSSTYAKSRAAQSTPHAVQQPGIIRSTPEASELLAAAVDICTADAARPSPAPAPDDCCSSASRGARDLLMILDSLPASGRSSAPDSSSTAVIAAVSASGTAFPRSSEETRASRVRGMVASGTTAAMAAASASGAASPRSSEETRARRVRGMVASGTTAAMAAASASGAASPRSSEETRASRVRGIMVASGTTAAMAAASASGAASPRSSSEETRASRVRGMVASGTTAAIAAASASGTASPRSSEETRASRVRGMVASGTTSEDFLQVVMSQDRRSRHSSSSSPKRVTRETAKMMFLSSAAAAGAESDGTTPHHIQRHSVPLHRRRDSSPAGDVLVTGVESAHRMTTTQLSGAPLRTDEGGATEGISSPSISNAPQAVPGGGSSFPNKQVYGSSSSSSSKRSASAPAKSTKKQALQGEPTLLPNQPSNYHMKKSKANKTKKLPVNKAEATTTAANSDPVSTGRISSSRSTRHAQKSSSSPKSGQAAASNAASVASSAAASSAATVASAATGGSYGSAAAGGLLLFMMGGGLEPILETSREHSSALTGSSGLFMGASSSSACSQNGGSNKKHGVHNVNSLQIRAGGATTVFDEADCDAAAGMLVDEGTKHHDGKPLIYSATVLPGPSGLNSVSSTKVSRRQWVASVEQKQAPEGRKPGSIIGDSQTQLLQQKGQQQKGQQQKESWELDASLFALGKRLGSGAYSTVYLAYTVDPAAAAAVAASADPGSSAAFSSAGHPPWPVTTSIGTSASDLKRRSSVLMSESATSVVGIAAGSRAASAANPAAAAAGGGSSRGSAVTVAGLARKCVVKKLDRASGKTFGVDYDAMNEVEVLQAAGHHPNLVHFHGWYRDPQDNLLCLVMGYCEGGTLSKLLKGKAGDEVWSNPEAHFPEEVVMSWFCQLLLALHHLHTQHIIHRDIKPDNILMSRNHKVIKLGDLGVAKQLEPSLELAITCLGTPYYMSPEVIAARPYTYASDIWSLGCVLYEMAARRTAFESVGLPQLMFKIIRTAYEPLPMKFSRQFQHLVNTMLRADPNDRPSTKDLLQMSMVRKYMTATLGLNLTPGTHVHLPDVTYAMRCLRRGIHPAAATSSVTMPGSAGRTIRASGATTGAGGRTIRASGATTGAGGRTIRASGTATTGASVTKNVVISRALSKATTSDPVPDGKYEHHRSCSGGTSAAAVASVTYPSGEGQEVTRPESLPVIDEGGQRRGRDSSLSEQLDPTSSNMNVIVRKRPSSLTVRASSGRSTSSMSNRPASFSEGAPSFTTKRSNANNRKSASGMTAESPSSIVGDGALPTSMAPQHCSSPGKEVVHGLIEERADRAPTEHKAHLGSVTAVGKSSKVGTSQRRQQQQAQAGVKGSVGTASVSKANHGSHHPSSRGPRQAGAAGGTSASPAAPVVEAAPPAAAGLLQLPAVITPNVHLVGGTKLQQWDSGAQYDQKVAKQAEARSKARALEGRLMREQARQLRKDRDPEYQAREAELKVIQQHLLARRQKKAIDAAQKEILQEALGEEGAAEVLLKAAAAQDGEGGAGSITAAGFMARDRLLRTPPIVTNAFGDGDGTNLTLPERGRYLHGAAGSFSSADDADMDLDEMDPAYWDPLEPEYGTEDLDLDLVMQEALNGSMEELGFQVTSLMQQSQHHPGSGSNRRYVGQHGAAAATTGQGQDQQNLHEGTGLAGCGGQDQQDLHEGTGLAGSGGVNGLDLDQTMRAELHVSLEAELSPAPLLLIKAAEVQEDEAVDPLKQHHPQELLVKEAQDLNSCTTLDDTTHVHPHSPVVTTAPLSTTAMCGGSRAYNSMPTISHIGDTPLAPASGTHPTLSPSSLPSDQSHDSELREEDIPASIITSLPTLNNSGEAVPSLIPTEATDSSSSRPAAYCSVLDVEASSSSVLLGSGPGTPYPPMLGSGPGTPYPPMLGSGPGTPYPPMQLLRSNEDPHGAVIVGLLGLGGAAHDRKLQLKSKGNKRGESEEEDGEEDYSSIEEEDMWSDESEGDDDHDEGGDEEEDGSDSSSGEQDAEVVRGDNSDESSEDGDNCSSGTVSYDHGGWYGLGSNSTRSKGMPQNAGGNSRRDEDLDSHPGSASHPQQMKRQGDVATSSSQSHRDKEEQQQDLLLHEGEGAGLMKEDIFGGPAGGPPQHLGASGARSGLLVRKLRAGDGGQNLEEQLAQAWEGADDGLKRKMLEQIWRLTVQEQQGRHATSSTYQQHQEAAEEEQHQEGDDSSQPANICKQVLTAADGAVEHHQTKAVPSAMMQSVVVDEDPPLNRVMIAGGIPPSATEQNNRLPISDPQGFVADVADKCHILAHNSATSATTTTNQALLITRQSSSGRLMLPPMGNILAPSTTPNATIHTIPQQDLSNKAGHTSTSAAPLVLPALESSRSRRSSFSASLLPTRAPLHKLMAPEEGRPSRHLLSPRAAASAAAPQPPQPHNGAATSSTAASWQRPSSADAAQIVTELIQQQSTSLRGRKMSGHLLAPLLPILAPLGDTIGGSTSHIASTSAAANAPASTMHTGTIDHQPGDRLGPGHRSSSSRSTTMERSSAPRQARSAAATGVPQAASPKESSISTLTGLRVQSAGEFLTSQPYTAGSGPSISPRLRLSTIKSTGNHHLDLDEALQELLLLDPAATTASAAPSRTTATSPATSPATSNPATLSNRVVQTSVHSNAGGLNLDPGHHSEATGLVSSQPDAHQDHHILRTHAREPAGMSSSWQPLDDALAHLMRGILSKTKTSGDNTLLLVDSLTHHASSKQTVTAMEDRMTAAESLHHGTSPPDVVTDESGTMHEVDTELTAGIEAEEISSTSLDSAELAVALASTMSSTSLRTSVGGTAPASPGGGSGECTETKGPSNNLSRQVTAQLTIEVPEENITGSVNPENEGVLLPKKESSDNDHDEPGKESAVQSLMKQIAIMKRQRGMMMGGKG